MIRHRELSKEAREFRASRGQLGQCGPEAITGGAHLVGPWFNSLSAARYLDQPTRHAFRMWAKRHGVIPVRRAGLMLYAKADIDRIVLGPVSRQRSA